MMHADVERVLLDNETISRRVGAMAAEITRDYEGKTPLVIGILKGAFIFMADLVRRISLPCEIDFLAASSYGSASQTSGTVRIQKDLSCEIGGRDILIVEDILDSGTTMSYIKTVMQRSHPLSLSICTLLDKPERRLAPVEARYVGFCAPDEFLVGYGLDYAGRYRNLPYIGVLKRSVYES